MFDPRKPHVLVLALAIPMFAAIGSGCSDDDPATLPADEVVKKGCSVDGDCRGGRCVEGLPGGLCTANCGADEDCPEGTICTDTEAANGVCLFPCTSAAQCVERVGSGYTCDSESSLTTGEDVRVCIDS